MTIRVGGRAVRPDAAELEAAFPDATDRVVVFLHGLGEHEGHWNTRAAEMGGTYGSRLAESAGWTPVFLRVNTGLSVAENGVALTALLQELVETWPVRVRRIALVGHSMGGLVIRAGCAVSTEHGEPGVDLLTDVVTLGTPHLGADLALGVSHGSKFLAPAARDRRLRPDPRAPLAGHPRPGARPARPAAAARRRYRLVSAALGSERSPVGALFGDLLVRRASATGLRRSLRLFPDADVLHVANAGHFALLNHPEVDHAMSGWLA